MSTHKEQIADFCRDLLIKCPVVLDTETTGLGEDAEIVEISIIDCNGNVLLDTLVKPQGTIAADASAIHGITETDVARAPTWPDLHAKVFDILSDRPVVMYNSDYDLRLIRQTVDLYPGLTNTSVDSVCLMLLYAQWWGVWDERRENWKWQKLTAAAEQCGVKVDSAHRALADCRTTLGILKRMVAFQAEQG